MFFNLNWYRYKWSSLRIEKRRINTPPENTWSKYLKMIKIFFSKTSTTSENFKILTNVLSNIWNFVQVAFMWYYYIIYSTFFVIVRSKYIPPWFNIKILTNISFLRLDLNAIVNWFIVNSFIAKPHSKNEFWRNYFFYLDQEIILKYLGKEKYPS